MTLHIPYSASYTEILYTLSISQITHTHTSPSSRDIFSHTLQSTLYASNSTRHTPGPRDFAPLYTLDNSYATLPALPTPRGTLGTRHAPRAMHHLPHSNILCSSLPTLHSTLQTIRSLPQVKFYTCQTTDNVTVSKTFRKATV